MNTHYLEGWTRRAMATSALALAAASSPALAQSDSQPDGRPVLEEIVVSADRTGTDVVQVGSFRGAKVLDTPLTINVITSEVLKSQQADGLLDALRNTPGVTSSQTNPTVYSNLDIRGIAVENRGSYRMNGSLPIVNLIDLPLENKERIEALKGASALYYGFTPPSGIINLVTKRPTEDPVMSVTAKGNSHGQIQGAIDAGGFFGPLGVRGNFAFGSVDSGIDRTTGFRSFQSGAFQFNAAQNLTFNLDVEHIYKRVTEPTIIQGPTARASLLTVIPKAPKGSTNPGSKGLLNKASETNVLGRVAYEISPAWQVIAEGGISYATRDRRFSRLANFNPETGIGRFTATAADGQLYRNRNVRAEVAGTFRTGPIVHELLFGASKNIRRQYSPRSASISCVNIGLAADCLQSLYDPIALPDVRFTGTVAYDPTRDTKIYDTGYYAFDRAKFGGPNGDMINVLVGVRKSDYREAAKTAEGGQKTTFSDKPFSVSGGLVFKPISDLSIYATYIEGLESTPGAPSTAENAGEILPASESKQYEAGIKYAPWRGMLITGTYFDIKRANAYTNADNVFVKDGQARYKGFEAAITGDVTPDLSVYATALFLDAKQGKTTDTTLIGNDIENAADKTWSVFAEYRMTSFAPGLAVNAGVFHVGKRAINPENSAFLPSYTLLNLGASFSTEIGGNDITFRVNAENVTGKRYWSSTAGNYLAWGAPPSVKLSMTMGLF